MSESRETEERMKLLPFDPKKSVWRVWSKQFLARAHVKGFKEVLLGTVKPMSDSEFESLRSTSATYAEAQKV
jgi:hypothetical protein